MELKTSEVFISDGSKCDCANILDIFALENVVAIGDPVYPVYNDTNVMIGRTGEANEQADTTKGWSTCRVPRRTASARPSRTRKWTSSTSASPTIRPEQWQPASN